MARTKVRRTGDVSGPRRKGAKELGLDAYRRLREAIIAGRFVPNERLVEANLSKVLGAGRTAVRAALVRLDQEGLVTREHNRGARVRLVSDAEALQIEEVRAALERLLARQAAAKANASDLRELRQVMVDMRRCFANGDAIGYSELNPRFHQLIWAAAKLHHRTGQRIDLHRPARLQVLQHRGLVVADSRGALDALVDRDRDLDAGAPRHRIDLFHGRTHHLRDDRRSGDLAQRRPRQRAERVEDGVAKELHPHLGPDPRLDGRLQAGARQRSRQLHGPGGDLAVELAEREALALDVPHDARAHQAGGGIDDAADDAHRVDDTSDLATGVDGVQMNALELSTVPLEVPPWDAVLRADHSGPGTQVRRHPRRHRRKAVGFERHEDGVGVAHRCEVVGRFDRDGPIPMGVDDAKARLLHRLQVRAAGDQHDVDAGACEARAEETADGPRAQHTDPHSGKNWSATNRRWTLPVGVRGIESTM